MLFDPARGFDEVHRVVVVFFNARGDGKHVGVKNDVFRGKAHTVHQGAIRPFADFNFALVGVGLALFIKSHDHRCSAIASNQARLVDEVVLAFFQADGVDDALALNAAQARLNHRPFRRVHHHRHAGNVGLGRHEVQKTHHGRFAVEHGFVHVHINDLRAVFHLLTRHAQGLFVLAIEDHSGKGLGAGDVGALTNVHEQAVRIQAHGLKP